MKKKVWFMQRGRNRWWLRLLSVVMVFGSFIVAKAADRYTVSVMTVGPSEKLYGLYGHTGIRVIDHVKNTDEVYNYGLFDFSQPKFLSNFIKGRPIYMVAKEPYYYFYNDNVLDKEYILEQELNLTPEMAERLVTAMEINILPENRDYLYNFIYDNCATRPLLLIDQYTGGIDHSPLPDRISFRSWMARCTARYPWQELGTNLALGYDADKHPKELNEMFLPIMVHGVLEGATWKANGEPVVKKRQTIFVKQETESSYKPSVWEILNPSLVFALLFCVYLITIVYSWRKNKYLPLKIIESLLMFIAGVGGLVVWYIAFGSDHPFTYPNLNVMLLHPFYLLLIPLLWTRKLKNIDILMHFINFVVLTVYIFLMVFGVQKLTQGIYWVFISLFLLSVKHALAQYMQRRREKKQLRKA